LDPETAALVLGTVIALQRRSDGGRRGMSAGQGLDVGYEVGFVFLSCRFRRMGGVVQTCFDIPLRIPGYGRLMLLLLVLSHIPLLSACRFFAILY